MKQAIAALERLVPRGVTAITSIVVAAVTSPEDFGLYTWAVIALTLFQAFSDQPIRQVAVPAVQTEAGRRMLATYTRAASLAGVGLLLAAVVIIGFASGKPVMTLELLPLVMVPAAVAMSTSAVAELQLRSEWARISGARLAGAIVGVSIGVTTAFATESVVGAALCVLISEAVFTGIVSRQWRRLAGRSKPTELQHANTEIAVLMPADEGTRGLLRSFRHMQTYSALAWAQGQLDRVLLGAWAGTAALGLYSLGTAVGRSGGDAVAASQANILRADLARDVTISRDAARTANRALVPGIGIAAAVVVLTITLTKWVLEPILGVSWADAMEVAPVLALTAFPSLIAWASAPLHVHRRRPGRANVAPAVSLLFAPLVAAIATQSLTAAAWVVVGREVALALTQVIILGRAAPWKAATIAFFALALSAVTVLALP